MPVETLTATPDVPAGGMTSTASVAANDPLVRTVVTAIEPLSMRTIANPGISDADLRSGLQTSSSNFSNVLTSSGQNAFQIAVAPASEPNLLRFRGIPDQDFVSNGAFSVQVPADAFVHTDAKAVVELSARMADGRAMPKWLAFDATTGKFSGEAPPDFVGDVVLVVEARDAEGRRAEAMFRIKLVAKRAEGAALEGRPGLSEQFRAAARRSDSFERAVTGREGSRKL